MIVLPLQSFLAVDSAVHNLFGSFLVAYSSVSAKVLVLLYTVSKCDSKYLMDYLTMAEQVCLYSLDLMEVYHFLHVSSLHQSLRAFNKGTTETVCLYSSQCECLSRDTAKVLEF